MKTNPEPCILTGDRLHLKYKPFFIIAKPHSLTPHSEMDELKECCRRSQVRDVEVKTHQNINIVWEVTRLALSRDLFADEIDLFDEYEEARNQEGTLC